jgi:tetratricopeptide (TPR) repeat protein
VYERLGDVARAARVHETMGRLELARGRREQAAGHLRSALESQQERGDLSGLARTAASLSSLLARAGQFDHALELLAESVALHARRGSPLGLALNRRALADLARLAPPKFSSDVEHVLRSLEQAEERLGRIHLPGER